MQQCNLLQFESGELAEENAELREKLGLEPRADKVEEKTKTGIVMTRNQQNRALLQVKYL